MHIVDKDKGEAVRNIARKLNEEIKIIGYKELNRTISGLALGRVATKSINLPQLYQMPELLVFIGVDDGKLDVFLDEYKKTGMEPVKLKAVATAHNVDWSIYELIEHLKEEAM